MSMIHSWPHLKVCSLRFDSPTSQLFSQWCFYIVQQIGKAKTRFLESCRNSNASGNIWKISFLMTKSTMILRSLEKSLKICCIIFFFCHFIELWTLGLNVFFEFWFCRGSMKKNILWQDLREDFDLQGYRQFQSRENFFRDFGGVGFLQRLNSDNKSILAFPSAVWCQNIFRKKGPKVGSTL